MSQYRNLGTGKIAIEREGDVRRILTPEARRALAEAGERHRAAEDAAKVKELNGRGGLEPVRFGDWEVKGIATDF